MKTWFKENSSHFIIIGIFLVLVFFYFSPIFGGKTLLQSDVLQAEGSQKELFDYKAKDGHAPLWTNSMFGGMPTYQIWHAHANNITTYISKGVRAVFPPPTDVVLLYLLGGYFLLSTLRIRPWLAAVGAIALAFTSYNFVYIEAGHLNRAYAIAYLPFIMGAIFMCYRGSRLWGPVLLALFLALEIRANHVQTTYYLFLAMLIYVLFALYYAFKDKQLKSFFQASALQLVAVAVAVLVNASVLFPTYEYSKLTIRGPSNIVKVDEGNSSGLDKQYAYDWSQGIGENITFLIPNAYGGRSGGVLDRDAEVVKTMVGLGIPEAQAMQAADRMFPTYWGEKMFTQGPWYFGASVIFLFILGLVSVKDRIKWWIVGVTVLSILLAFGKHFPLISDLFFDYFPMYNKFRAVESILIIPAILIPLLAVLAVNELITRGDTIPKLDKKVLYTFIGVGGFCLLVAFVPSLFLDFKTSNHQTFVSQVEQVFGGDKGAANEVVRALIKDRTSLATADAYRSFFIVALTFGLIWFFIKKKLGMPVLVGVLGIIILADLWSVDKRYLNNDSFVDSSTAKARIPEREVDQLIRLDKDLSYRVFDLTRSPFQDAMTSYYHKSLGGYHAAKLMRFQEILEHQFNGAINEDVLDMFNVRYLITQNPQNGAEQIQRRGTASGNAWFVERVTFVKDNAQEMQAISSFDPKKEAFVHEEFKNKLNATRLGQPGNADINLVSYHPDTLVYESTSPNDAFAVFSEVYYDKGWKAYIDDQEVPIIRANYILRALQVPGGNHTIKFVFAPDSMRISEMISLIASIILVLGLAVAVWFSVRKKKA